MPQFVTLSKEWREVEWLITKVGAYNLFDPNWAEVDAIQLFCAVEQGFCNSFLAWLADSDPEVDNLDRVGVLLKDFPAGSGYQNIVYYA